MAEAYIKLFKKMLKWEWYDDPNTCRLFIHCLLKANWKPGSWHGITYEAGQFITSLNTLSKETGLSFQQTRTALEHLKSTNELTDFRQSNYRIITVVKWYEYQGDNKPTNNKVTDLQQIDNKPLTTDKEYKEYKEEKKKNIYGEYKHVRLTQKQFDKLVEDYSKEETLEAIKFLDEYIQMKGYKAKDHNLALRKWVFNAVSEDRARPKPKRKPKTDYAALLEELKDC